MNAYSTVTRRLLLAGARPCTPVNTISRHSAAATTRRPQHLPRPSALLYQRRYKSTAPPPTAPRPLTDRETDPVPSEARSKEPSYQITFTCRRCMERSQHNVTKQAYHRGTTLITCPGCKNRHLISDHLKIFSDKRITLEDILREKGQLLRKGSFDVEGNVEFWEGEGDKAGGDVDGHGGDPKS